jgi:alanine or glycine:cation symporter, AGCS family
VTDRRQKCDEPNKGASRLRLIISRAHPLGGTVSDLLAATFDERVEETLAPWAERIESVVFFSVSVGGTDLPLIVVWLVVAGLVFTGYLGLINLRGFGHAVQLARGKYADPANPGEVSHFGALATALSGTVGLGNIAGVAVAITLGGPGATFWMILAGFVGMATKFTECTLGVKYRLELPDGQVSGGPMHYLSKGLAAERGLKTFGLFLAGFFCVMTMGAALGGGNAFQSNQAYEQVRAVTGGDDSPIADVGWLFGIVLALAVGLVILGGIKGIARVTTKLVPFMAILYVTAGLVVIAFNLSAVPGAFGEILSGAFTGAGVAGGVVGALIVGFQRAAFSNEAGLGSAAIAHSAVKTDRPVTEGHVALLEPFIDTIIVCTTTALVIVITGAYTAEDASDGVALTSEAFETALPFFPTVLAIAVVLFAFSTMLAWSYYGVKSARWLFGENQVVENVYKVVFLVFVVLGASVQLEAVLAFSDSMIFLMALPNVVGLYLLAPVVKRELAAYRTELRSGALEPADS